jgi:hypothetical protein
MPEASCSGRPEIAIGLADTPLFSAAFLQGHALPAGGATAGGDTLQLLPLSARTVIMIM